MKHTQPLTLQTLIQNLLTPHAHPHPHPHPHPINYTFYGQLLQICTNRRLTRQAKQLHARFIISSTTTTGNLLASKLIAFYSKTNNLLYSRHVFNQMPHKNTFAFNALLISYSLHSHHMETIKLFTSLLSRTDDCGLEDVEPDSFTLSCVLKAMSEVALDGPISARIMHCYVIKRGLYFDVFVGNGLITYYSRCDDLLSARAYFDEMPKKDLVSWNSMISGYSQGGFYEECKDLYRMLLKLEDFRPDGLTIVSILHACAQSTDLIFGMEVHRYVIDNGIKLDISACNSVISIYAKCGSLNYARELFEEMSDKNEITYSTIISGYMVHGFVDEAMKIFREMKNPGLSNWNAVISGQVQNNKYDEVEGLAHEMQVFGLKPNSVTLLSILPAIPHVSHLKGAKEIHAYGIKISSNTNIYVVTAMIDVYAKLGYLSGAQTVFDQTKDRSVIVWTTIISAHAAHGDANTVRILFDKMLNSKTKPDVVIFTVVLSACAHAGLVDEAWEIFDFLLPKYGIHPLVYHYACMVLCMCRAGQLSEAAEFVQKMWIKPDAKVWGALLSGAAEAGDVELAKLVCDHLFELEPENPTNYVVMANLYSNVGRWKEAERVREKLSSCGFKKVAGSSRVGK